jgi:DNA repair exonuclease SbcCD nuclease subunit
MFFIRYEQYYRRFNAIFYLPSGIPAYFIPGNHDIGYISCKICSYNED